MPRWPEVDREKRLKFAIKGYASDILREKKKSDRGSECVREKDDEQSMETAKTAGRYFVDIV